MTDLFDDDVWNLEQMIENVESALDDIDRDSPRYAELTKRRDKLLDQLDAITSQN